MMRPLGLYLAEFRPDSAVAVPTASVPGGLPLLPDLGTELEGARPALVDLEAEPIPMGEPDALPMLGYDDAEPVALLAAPAEPSLAEALAAQAAEHEATLAAARLAWTAETGDALAARFADALAALETRIADALASLLEPFLTHAVRAKALVQLHDAIERLMGGAGDARPVTVSGPADLVSALQARLGDRPGLAFAEADTPDVTVALADTRIRSQLRAFTRRLESALGDAT